MPVALLQSSQSYQCKPIHAGALLQSLKTKLEDNQGNPQRLLLHRPVRKIATAHARLIAVPPPVANMQPTHSPCHAGSASLATYHACDEAWIAGHRCGVHLVLWTMQCKGVVLVEACHGCVGPPGGVAHQQVRQVGGHLDQHTATPCNTTAGWMEYGGSPMFAVTSWLTSTWLSLMAINDEGTTESSAATWRAMHGCSHCTRERHLILQVTPTRPV